MTAGLFDHHREILEQRAISAPVARARGYSSTMAPDALRRQYGFSESASECIPGLLIPVHDVHGDVAFHQYRPDKPRKDDKGKPVKYETPPDVHLVLDAPPPIRGKLVDPSSPLWVTESPLKADAAVSVGLTCIAMFGVWGWRGTNARGGKTTLADWEEIALNDRTVYLAPDSDVATNPKVATAIARLGAMLDRRGADVKYVYIPPRGDGGKVGLDDYFASGGTVQDLMWNAEHEPPEGSRGSGGIEVEEWATPVPLAPRLPAFPVHLLPGVLGQMVQAVAATTQTPPDLAAFAGLATLSAATRGRWRVVVRKDWPEESALYMAALSQSGHLKSAVVRLITKPLYDEEKRLRSEGAAEYANLNTEYTILEKQASKAIDMAAKSGTAEAREEAKKLARELAGKPRPFPFQLLTGDTSPENLGRMMYEQGGAMATIGAEGEFFECLGRYAKDDSAPPIEIINHAFNGEGHRVGRITRESYDIDRAFLAIGVVVTPDVILNAVKNRPVYATRGLLPRFLFALPASGFDGLKFDAPDIDVDLAEQWRNCVAAILGKAMKMKGDEQVDMSLSEDALKLFAPFWEEITSRLDDKRNGDLAEVQAWGSKLRGTILRVALLITVAGNPDGVSIYRDTIANMIELSEYLIPHARAVLRPDRYQRDVRKVAVLKWVRRRVLPPEPLQPLQPAHGAGSRGFRGIPAYFTGQQAWQGLRDQTSWVESADDVSGVLEALADDGWLRRRPDPPRSPKGGRPPAPTYDVNPAVADLDL